MMPPIEAPDARKRFSTLRAQLAMHGVALVRTATEDGPQRLYLDHLGVVTAITALEQAVAYLDRLTAGMAGAPAVDPDKRIGRVGYPLDQVGLQLRFQREGVRHGRR